MTPNLSPGELGEATDAVNLKLEATGLRDSRGGSVRHDHPGDLGSGCNALHEDLHLERRTVMVQKPLLVGDHRVQHGLMVGSRVGESNRAGQGGTAAR
jgi:hypothetical protein